MEVPLDEPPCRPGGITATRPDQSGLLQNHYQKSEPNLNHSKAIFKYQKKLLIEFLFQSLPGFF